MDKAGHENLWRKKDEKYNECKKSYPKYREGIRLLKIRERNVLRGTEKPSRRTGNARVSDSEYRFHLNVRYRRLYGWDRKENTERRHPPVAERIDCKMDRMA
jgi:hypothetical protein